MGLHKAIQTFQNHFWLWKPVNGKYFLLLQKCPMIHLSIYCSWKLKNWILFCLCCSDTQDQGSAWLWKGKQTKFTKSCQFDTLYCFCFVFPYHNDLCTLSAIAGLFRELELLVRFPGLLCMQLQINSAYLTLIWYFEQIKSNYFSP